MPHPEIEVERAHLAFARDCLEAMRVRTASFVAADDLLAANEADTEAVRWQLQRRLRALDDDGVLCFGRIDEEGAGARWHVGRRHVDDEAGDPVVVDWRAPVAIPFYRATGADPLGLDARRRFTFAGRELADIYEEDFTDPDSMLADSGAHGVPDPLLGELRRERTGQMRDIVATIQAEQDVVIRAPLDECLVVQGGPGTGKTAVGLHRAAFLLYEQRDQLSRTGVLVLGPNPVFLDYIAQVLPSLGEHAVTQTTLDGLFGLRYRLGIHDGVERARLLGDARWAAVIASSAAEAVRIADHDLVLRYRSRVVRIASARVADLVAEARDRDTALKAQRLRFRARLLREAYEQWSGGEFGAVSEDEFAAVVLAHGPSRAAVDAVWKTVAPLSLVRSLLTSRATLARAADDIFDAAEQQVILRERLKEGSVELWSSNELALIDEADALVVGQTRRYGHVVVDEAQDLSPMALRLIGRRALRHSLTILGDLAQATGAHASTSWHAAIEHLGSPAGVRRAELTIGYRLPAAILEFANRLLERAAPHVTPATSAREHGDPPLVNAHPADELTERVAESAIALTQRHHTTGIVAQAERHAELREALHARDPSLDLTSGSITRALSLLDPSSAKGLEFDAVIVVEPADIFDDGAHGPRLLYVALTRAVQELVVAHSRPLPRLLVSS